MKALFLIVAIVGAIAPHWFFIEHTDVCRASGPGAAGGVGYET